MNAQLQIHVLASGSKGNAAVIVNTREQKALVIDCGICKRDFFDGCAEVGVGLETIEGILITHEHTDHTKGLGVVTRGLAAKGYMPRLYVGKRTGLSSSEIKALENTVDIHYVNAEDALALAGLTVTVFETSHDTVESFGFRVEAHKDALGYMTDTGIVTPQAYEALRDCRILCIESNHDTHMLETGPYPYPLKKRVASERGHLSNDQAAEALEKLMDYKLEHVIAMHISENNNTYRIARERLEEALARHDHPALVSAAYQHRITSSPPQPSTHISLD